MLGWKSIITKRACMDESKAAGSYENGTHLFGTARADAREEKLTPAPAPSKLHLPLDLDCAMKVPALAYATGFTNRSVGLAMADGAGCFGSCRPCLAAGYLGSWKGCQRWCFAEGGEDIWGGQCICRRQMHRASIGF
jgi:hypothetical protein|uniref:Uncharacterized protein n=1 Tax=Eutreptiella gymnastica TaxID=73025 RepID=A0A7S4FTI4_9EUGL